MFSNVVTECISGYTGPNCTSICPYPTYGDNCQHICDCSKDECDFSSGCNSLTSGNVSLNMINFTFIVEFLYSEHLLMVHFFLEKQTFPIATTKIDNPFSKYFTIRNIKPDFSSYRNISFQKREQIVLIILTIICLICACIIFATVVVWFPDKRRREPRNAQITVKRLPEHLYENIENLCFPFLKIQ